MISIPHLMAEIDCCRNSCLAFKCVVGFFLEREDQLTNIIIVIKLDDSIDVASLLEEGCAEVRH